MLCPVTLIIVKNLRILNLATEAKAAITRSCYLKLLRCVYTLAWASGPTFSLVGPEAAPAAVCCTAELAIIALA